MKNTRKYIKIVLQAISLLGFATADAQVPDPAPFIQNHTTTTEAGSFNFSSNSVDYYTGKASTSIPIHTYKGRELDLPMALSYTSDGVQVEELASITGLGWNLDFGGRITTTLSGEVDFLYSMGNSYIRDLYTLQVPGITEYFKMEYHQPMAQINPAIGAQERYGASDNWIISMPDGSKYFFEDAKEITTIYKSNGGQLVPNYSFASSWLLTKIISKNGLDVYKFEYNNYTWQNTIANGGEGYWAYDYGWNVGASPYTCTQRNPSAVYHNDEKIIGFTYGNRNDMVFTTSAGNALQSINFYNYKGSPDNTTTTADDPTIFKKAVFSYTYFGNAGSSNYLDKRLKLDNLIFYGLNSANPSGIAGDKYEFVYDNPTLVPNINSFAQDYLGLYNGVTGNTNLVENMSNYNSPAKRKYDFVKSQYGILKKIIYPTKGYTEFEYEQNRINDAYQYYYQGDSFREDQVDVAMVNYNAQTNPSVGGTWSMCEPNGAHANMMGQINFDDFHIADIVGDVRYLGVRSTILTVTEEDTFYLDTPGNGYGIYLIQSLAGVTCSTTNVTCDTKPTGPSTPTCWRPVHTIVYKGVSYNPDGFIKGGVTHYPSEFAPDESVVLPAGRYQITVWSYYNNNTNPPSSHLRVYKKVNTFVPGHLVSANTAGTLADGFRIKSMTSYSGSNIFAGKKDFKYNKGKLFHPTTVNYSPGVRISSQGYLYSDVVYYESVTERVSNLAGTEFNGSTEYIYGNADDPADDYVEYKPISHKGLNRDYELGQGGTTYLKIDAIHNSDLKEKKVYGSDGVLRYAEKHHYGFGHYTASVWHWGGMRLDGTYDDSVMITQPGIFPVTLSSTITNYPALDKGISTTTNYYYDETGETPTMLASSETYGPNVDRSEFFTYGLLPNLGYGLGTIIEGVKYYNNYTVYYGSPLNINTSPSLYLSIDISNKGRTDFEYDDAKNLVTVIKYTTGTLTPASYETYIYGYSNRFPVAKITGKKYSEILAAVPTVVANIKTSSNLPVSAANDTALRNNLNALRTNFPDCLITTYTYDPALGVTSITDPKGYTLHYEYDIFGRLRYTKENAAGNLNILSESQYNNRP